MALLNRTGCDLDGGIGLARLRRLLIVSDHDEGTADSCRVQVGADLEGLTQGLGGAANGPIAMVGDCQLLD